MLLQCLCNSYDANHLVYVPPLFLVFIHASEASAFDTINSEAQAIRALSGKALGSLTIVKPEGVVPSGCAVVVVSSAVAVFLEVKGRVNVEEEIAKARSKLDKSADSAARQAKLINAPDFVERASDAVMEVEKEKLAGYLAEQRNFEQTIAQFEKLRLEA